MPTAKQAAANRSNAAKSTGPRTKSGKTRSSRNALKHGLSAEQVVIFDEDPTAFDNLRDDLYAHYKPADPVAENLVEQVAACIWRLRRVPEIEAGIFESHYLVHQADRARQDLFAFPDLAEEKDAIERGDDPRPVLGSVFGRAQRSLSSLIRIASTIESSMYRAVRELEHRKANREEVETDHMIIDLEPEDTPPLEPSGPRLIES